MVNKLKLANKRKRLDKGCALRVRKKALLGVMDILILNWVKKQPICGLDIMQRILKEFGVYIGPGTLYPILYNLQKKGFIESKLYNKKKMYFLTKKGKVILRKYKRDYLKLHKQILNFLKQ